MSSPYQTVVEKLDLKGALTRGSEPNDLLLPRAEDKVRGEVGNRFLKALRRDLERGTYDPVRAYTVRVAKSSHGTRPAALLTLNDRVVYEAIVATLRPRIEQYLLGDAIVFWPRGFPSEKAWLRFEHAAAPEDKQYVVVADIAGFYESIDHQRLAERLIRATGQLNEVEALTAFLRDVMGCARGLPQGLEPSDPLATAYLGELDFAMVREGFAYYRHGDDIRIPSETYDRAREAIYALETRAREGALLLNGDKTKILRAKTYKKELQSIEDTLADTRSRVLEGKLAALQDDPEELAAAIDLANMEQLGWDFFYHGRISLHDVIEELRPTLEPSEVEVAEKLFADTWKRRPGRPTELASAEFHQRLVASLVRLAAGRSEKGLAKCGAILTEYPEKSEVVCSYLLALAEMAPQEVAAQAAKALDVDRFGTEWEAAWALRVLAAVAQEIPSDLQERIRELIASPFDSWFSAVEAARVLGVRGELKQEVLVRLWNSCPPVFRADLLVAVGSMPSDVDWAQRFVSAVKDDRIHEVVLKQAVHGADGGTKATGE